MERYAGIDLGVKTKHKVTIFDGPNQLGNPFSIEMSRDGLEYLLKKATQNVEGPVNFVFEPTSTVWLPISAYVSAAGHRVYMVKTQKSSDFRKFFSKHAKSDSIDAGVLARIPQIDPKGVNELTVPTARETTLKRLVKRRERYVSDASKQKLRIEALLLMVNPFLMKALGQEKFGKTTVEFLKKYADPKKVVKLGQAGLERFWLKHSKGRADKQRAVKVFEACQNAVELYEHLRKDNRLPFDYQAVQLEICEELELMADIESQAQQVEKQSIEIYKALHPERILEQLRGVGPIIATCLIAIIGNISRFKNIRQFISYCGLCPRKKQTGTSDKKMKITKAGSSILKKSLYLAADVARQWDPEFAAYYARRYAKGDHHDYIVVALARKMALRVYALLKRHEASKQLASSLSETNSSPSETENQARYILRTPEGREVAPKEAREIIKKKYAREIVAPQRAKRDRAAKKTGIQEKTKKPIQSEKRWPPKDATNGVASASLPNIATASKQHNTQVEQNVESGNQGQRIESEKSKPILLSELMAENLKMIVPDSLRAAVENMLKKCE